MLEGIRLWWRDVSIGKAPEIIEEYCLSGRPNPATKTAITKVVNGVLSINKKKHFKFGKTGHAISRIDYEDYRSAPYVNMYLLYQSKIPSFVESLEKYYSLKYYNNKFNKNVDTNSIGKMKSRDGNYYLYLVI